MPYKFVKISVSGMPYFYEFDTDTCETSHTVFPPFTRHQIKRFLRGLFTWREGAPVNWATRLEGLKHSPPLHATHLTGTVSGLRALSFERPLSTTNLMADQGNFFPSYFSFLHGQGPVLCQRLVYYIDLFRLTVILFGR